MERQQLEELFRRHIGYETPSADMTHEITRATEKWARKLRGEITTMPRGDYLASQKFLLGIKYSAGAMVQG